MLVDCHVHSWRYPDHFNKPAMLASQPQKRRDWPESRFIQMWDAPIERYFPEMEGAVDRAILQGLSAWNTMGVTIPNDYMASVVKSHPDKLSWCCVVDPTDEGSAEEVERCVTQLGAVGVGELCPGYAGYYLNDPRCFQVYEKAQALGVPIVVHAGPTRPPNSRVKYGDPMLVDEIALDFPELKIVICHMGYYRFEDTVFLLEKHPNVFADVSWLSTLAGLERNKVPRYVPVVPYPYHRLLHPVLLYFSQTLGEPDKLIWGSDWMACSPRDSLQIWKNINEKLGRYGLPEIPEKSIHNLLHENWRKIFDLG